MFKKLIGKVFGRKSTQISENKSRTIVYSDVVQSEQVTEAPKPTKYADRILAGENPDFAAVVAEWNADPKGSLADHLGISQQEYYQLTVVGRDIRDILRARK